MDVLVDLQQPKNVSHTSSAASGRKSKQLPISNAILSSSVRLLPQLTFLQNHFSTHSPGKCLVRQALLGRKDGTASTII